MKLDDPRLQQAHKEMAERVKKLDDLIVTTLKYHVSVESSMVELIEAHGKKADDTFAAKIAQCQDINPPGIEAATWNLLKEANRLRNAIAHKIGGKEVQEAMKNTRKAYAALSAQSAKDEQAMTDVQLALSAFTHCGSFIVVATESKRQGG